MRANKLFLVFGIGRSGLHAICHWILYSAGGSCIFFNAKKDQPGYTRVPSSDEEKSDPFAPNPTFKQFYQAAIILDEDAYAQTRDFCYGFETTPKHILILRDPYNLVSSRHAAGRLSRIDMWLQHARFFLNLPTDFVGIKYNNWFSDTTYRKKISRELGIPFTNRIQHVPQHGGGSSFDGLHYQGKAQKMKVFNRWQHIRESHPELFSNKEIKELSKKIFAFDPS